eukprot:13066416-Alexandrium_andersonii.AAC.1
MNKIPADEADCESCSKFASVLCEEVRGECHLEAGDGDLLGAANHDVVNPDEGPDEGCLGEEEACVSLAAGEALLD